MVLSLDEFCTVACDVDYASWLLEFSENVKTFDIQWRGEKKCDVQAYCRGGGTMWLQGKVLDVHPSGAVCVQILRRSTQTCKPNWVHPMHLLPCGAECTSPKMNNLWTPMNEIDWAVYPLLP